MKCPNCNARKGIAVFSADGYSSKGSPIKECEKCEHVWRIVPTSEGNKTDIIRQGKEIIKKTRKKA